MRKIILTIFLVMLLVGTCYAVPNTLAATNVNNNNFTLNSNGYSGEVFFKYGTNPDYQNIYTQNTSSGIITEQGSPIQPSTHYYVSACDQTGCDSTGVELTTLAITPIPQTTFGTAITNMTKSKFNILYITYNIVTPYTWLSPSSDTETTTMFLTIIFGMMFFFIYVGLWLRTRSVATPVVIGLLTSSFILFTNQGLNLGIPVEFQSIAQALLYASLGGILLTFMKK